MLSREKQIEEMAKDINISDHEYCNGRCIGCEHKPKRIEDCACIDIAIATGLTTKGYRKDTEVAEEIFGEIEKLFKQHRIEFDMSCIDFYFDKHFRELKKKYTGEGK